MKKAGKKDPGAEAVVGKDVRVQALKKKSGSKSKNTKLCLVISQKRSLFLQNGLFFTVNWL